MSVGSNFYPRPPRGGRPRPAPTKTRTVNFYPRPPRGGRPGGSAGDHHPLRNFYPRPPRGGPLYCCDRLTRASYFYPRPPRGGRLCKPVAMPPEQIISIHALREEGDTSTRADCRRPTRFLSTPSARRATQESEQNTSTTTYFYPRPPRGGRPIKEERALELLEISIHALREEGDNFSYYERYVR